MFWLGLAIGIFIGWAVGLIVDIIIIRNAGKIMQKIYPEEPLPQSPQIEIFGVSPLEDVMETVSYQNLIDKQICQALGIPPEILNTKGKKHDRHMGNCRTDGSFDAGRQDHQAGR